MSNTVLYIEPFVQIFVNQFKATFYNTLDGNILEYNSNIIKKTAQKLKSIKHQYVVNLSEEEIGSKSIKIFVDDLRSKFMGDVLQINSNMNLPRIIIPKPINYKDIRKLRKSSDFSQRFSEEKLSFINELTFHLNNLDIYKIPISKKHAFKQFNFPRQSASKQELSIKDIIPVIEMFRHRKLSFLNFIGNSILSYSKFSTLLEYLENLDQLKHFYIGYYDIDFKSENLINLIKTCNKNNNNGLNVLVLQITEVINQKLLNKFLQLLQQEECSYEIEFIIESKKEYSYSESILQRYPEINYRYFPLYNGKNKVFFEKFVYISKEDILDSKLTEKEIFMRMTINSQDFGKLIIFNDGSIHSNANYPRLGNLKKDNILDMITKEIKSNYSWFKTRNYFNPCKSCNYKYLCPSPSNYEKALKKVNLCNIVINSISS